MKTSRCDPLILHIPDLFWPEPLDEDTLAQADCPALAWLLAKTPLRVVETSGITVSSESALLVALACESDAPIAPLRLWGEARDGVLSAPGEDYWICVDPVQLRFHHEQVLLADASSVSLTADEVQALIAGLNRDFADLGEFIAPVPDRWYLKLAPAFRQLSPATAQDVVPLSAVAGRRLQGDAVHLQSSPSQAKVRQWQNEIQMWLHAHPVNQGRREQGRVEVNGVWLWGGGVLPAKPDRRPNFAAVHASSENPLLQGLLRWLGLPQAQVRDISSPTERTLDSTGAGPVFELIEDLIIPVRYQDDAAWRAALAQIDRYLAAQLAKKQPLILQTTGSYGSYSLDTRESLNWAFWRRPQPLANVLQNLKTQA